ncbi:isochorismatase family cysteine hydrolase [Salinisphaera sp. Q1T1-3]|uniref:isochorismatase family cysteine hydrolase n=1 Tax=Salinisphaera sp. Q1T1-3 TaxID=2321229 RepID=UPI000E72F2FF|nr:isochorismatase family cysteine hydrolase [Salinisphaera sp. Q1T1-3]RJS91195.1 cysteine hydrolase [Salinisphaera sp. Q1T1-3]
MTTALIALDFINDIVHPDSPMADAAPHIAERNVIGNANSALAHARANDWLVVLVKVGFGPGYTECPAHSPLFGAAKHNGVLQLGSWGTEFHEQLDATPANAEREYVLEKPRVNAFYATPLEAVLRANAIDTLFLCGVSTTWAVQAAARDGHDRDYRIRVIEDACAAAEADDHAASIAQLSRIADIVSAAELASA